MADRKRAKRALTNARNLGVASAKRTLGPDACCEVCGWRLLFVAPNDSGKVRGLHGHHIVPVADGGSLEPVNVIVLCPNHHTLAHAIGDVAYRKWRGKESDTLVRNRLIAWLRLADSNPTKLCREIRRMYPGADYTVPTAILPFSHGSTTPLLIQPENNDGPAPSSDVRPTC